MVIKLGTYVKKKFQKSNISWLEQLMTMFKILFGRSGRDTLKQLTILAKYLYMFTFQVKEYSF